MADATVDKVSKNPVLNDIADIAAARPELTAKQWEVVEKAAPYYKALLKPEVRSALENEYVEKYEEFVSQSRIEMQKAVSDKFEEWKALQQPLDTKELKKLISQEYETVSFQILTEEGKERSFTIRELPKSVEKRFLELAKKVVVPLLEEKQLAEFKFSLDSSMAEKINALVSLVPSSTDVLAEICAICLDPFGKEKIDGNWVSANLSLTRIQAIVLLQFEVNKYRDFFLSSFRMFRNLKMRMI